MQTNIIEKTIVTAPGVRILFKSPKLSRIGNKTKPHIGLLKTVSEIGLDRLTEKQVENVICTSALSAHI